MSATTAAAPSAMRYDGAAYCPRCGCDTATGLLRLSSGHIGRVCCQCRALRKGRPYASRRDYELASLIQPMPERAEGVHATAPQ